MSEECAHCGYEVEMTDVNDLCRFCVVTRSASRWLSGGSRDFTVTDVASMLNELLAALREEIDRG